MKKILFLTALAANLLLACGQKDNKNEVEPYPTYDTTQTMERINGPDSTSPHNQNGQGDMTNENGPN